MIGLFLLFMLIAAGGLLHCKFSVEEDVRGAFVFLAAISAAVTTFAFWMVTTMFNITIGG